MRALLLCLIALVAGTPAPAAADTIRFTLGDHPRGEARPPTYGLRLDDLFGPSTLPTTFSFNQGGAAVLMDVDTTSKSIHIFGTVFGGVDVGDSYLAPELFDLDMLYKFGVMGNEDDGWSVAGLGNTGSLVRQSDSQRWDLVTLLNQDGFAFEFFPDRFRLRHNDLVGVDWVGRGWLDTSTNSRPTEVRDFLFVATVVPLPAAVIPGVFTLGCAAWVVGARSRRARVIGPG
jgi:hypothetical protein